MGRPTKDGAAAMLREMSALVAEDMSINEIARATGKSPQAVQKYLTLHGIPTRGMREKAKLKVDNHRGAGQECRSGKET